MPDTPSQSLANFGQFAISGAYGSAWKDTGQGLAKLFDVVEVAASISRNQIEVPQAGSFDTHYKGGAIGRTGTFTVTKYDTYWEALVQSILQPDPAVIRKLRDRGEVYDPSFVMQIEHDDPTSFGVERWRLDGVMVWNLDIGFSRGDDLTQRQYQMTFAEQHLLKGFQLVRNGNTVAAKQLVS